MTMHQHGQVPDLQIHVNGQQRFVLSQQVVSRYSGWMRNVMSSNQVQLGISALEIDDFPGGSFGFEFVSRFCYNDGEAEISVSNVLILHCCAVYLDMTEEYAVCNLLRQTEAFLDGMLGWSWSDVLMCLKSGEPVFEFADSCGLVDKVVYTLLAKITQNSDQSFVGLSPSSFSSSPESLAKSSSSVTKAWWFEDLTIFAPKTILSLTKCLGSFGSDNHSLLLTEFLFHYLKSCKSSSTKHLKSDEGYGDLAETALHEVISAPKGTFTCRKLFWVLRLVSRFNVSKVAKFGLESLIGEMLDKATLDDLLVSGSKPKGAYDVNLVLRLTKMFVESFDEFDDIQKMKKVGRLIDRYLGEISPDHNLKVSKFLKVAESLPDCARDCFDGVYRAIDIYLESHPSLLSEERAKLCRCLKYEKLSLEVCKYLAKNPKIPPTTAIEALKSQPCCHKTKEEFIVVHMEKPKMAKNNHNIELLVYNEGFANVDSFSEGSEDMRKNIKKMQRRVVELEEVCKEMKSQMSSIARKSSKGSSISHNYKSSMPRLC